MPMQPRRGKTAWASLRTWFRRLTLSLRRDGALAAGWKPAEAGDYLWAACSVQQWNLLTDDCGWAPAKARAAITRTVAAALLTDP